MSNGAISVEVLYSFEPPAELLEDLTGGSWRVMAEAPGHLGVHAANTFHDGVNTFPSWYSAAPFDKSETGMYDDRITFNADGTMDYEAFDYIFGHSYTNTYQSSTEMYLKTIGFDNNAWYIKLTNQ